MVTVIPADLAHTLAEAAGIPRVLLPSVLHRVQVASLAVSRATGYRPLGAGAELLVRRVVAGAVADYRRGTLERRCT